MAISGITLDSYGSSYSYNYSYNSGLDSKSWSDNANKQTEELKTTLGITDKTNAASTDKTNAASTDKSTTTSASTSAGSASGFLMGYQTRLESLESSASKLMTTKKDNVFGRFDTALKSMEKGEEGAQEKVGKATDDVVSAVKDLVKNYNDTMSYLKKNGSYGSGLSSQMESLKRSIPTEQGLSYLGMSVDTTGELKVDESKLRETLKNDPQYVKGGIGGQFGIADRLGAKATSILDSSVDKVLGNSKTASSTSSGTDKSSSSTSSSSNSNAASSNQASMMSDSFKQFASFARGGAFNLSNYYAVSMLNILA